MLLVVFERKANCIDDLNFNNRIEFLKKYGKKVRIEKEITLSETEYETFINNLNDDYAFIAKNKELMYTDKDGVWHCILVRSKENPHMILVQSEGYDYARYTAIFHQNNMKYSYNI